METTITPQGSGMVEWVVIWGIIAVASTAIAGLLAGWKNRDYSFWMGWSFVVPPLVLILVFLPKRDQRRRRPTLDDEDAAEV
ncbi:hypothetical protein ACO2I3_16860 [Leptospira interrogans]